VCVLEKNTKEFVRELREIEEEEALQAAAPTRPSMEIAGMHMLAH
jgi:hypothetical protein